MSNGGQHNPDQSLQQFLFVYSINETPMGDKFVVQDIMTLDPPNFSPTFSKPALVSLIAGVFEA